MRSPGMAREMGGAQRQQSPAKEGRKTGDWESCTPGAGGCRGTVAWRIMVRMRLHIPNDFFL